MQANCVYGNAENVQAAYLPHMHVNVLRSCSYVTQVVCESISHVGYDTYVNNVASRGQTKLCIKL